MTPSHVFEIDPAAVLGVSAEATLQEIRDAYRAKAKRYHPDAGGEAWAFRVVVQAYESLSTARLARAATREAETPRAPRPPTASAYAGPRPGPGPGFGFGAGPNPTAPPFGAGAGPPPFGGGPPPFGSNPGGSRGTTPPPTNESVRPGVRESAPDPSRLVDVEKLSIRHEAEHLWLITDRGTASTLLSSCLNIAWPDVDVAGVPSRIDGAQTILNALESVFDALALRTQPAGSRSTVVDGRFNGWLSYPNAEKTNAAFAQLRGLLHAEKLYVKQWSRDLVIPKTWQ